MPDLGSVGTWIGVVLFAGSVVVFLRGSRDKGTIATLEANNKALTERVTLLEGDVARITAKALADKNQLSTRVDALERENTALLAQRPSAEAIADLNAKADRLETDLSRHDIETRRLLKEIKP